jgi:anti-sigma factor RsiW
MNCVELQASLAEIDDGRSIAQRAHLKNCPECSALVTELILIASTAVELREMDGPGPHVWKAIETTLRREGVIRPQKANRSLLPSFSSRWGWARWVVPAAAALLLTVGLYMRQHSVSPELARTAAPPAPGSDLAIAGLNDDDLLQEVSAQSPAMQAQYADNLRRVNEYIQDAKGVVAANPNDEEARRSLLEAYQQKAMLFDLAMDRSLP